MSEDKYIRGIHSLAKHYNKEELLKYLPWILEGNDPFFCTSIGLERFHCVFSLEYMFREYLKIDGDWSKSHSLVAKQLEETNIYLCWHYAKQRGLISKHIKVNPKMEQFFKDFYDKIFKMAQNDEFRRMLLAYRGWFKTTLDSIAHTIQELIIDPEAKILIMSGSEKNVNSIVQAIKAPFMYNDKFRAIFPEYCPVPGKTGKIEFGTQDSFTLPNRRSFDVREPSVKGASINTSLTGLHFTKHKYDDLIDEDNCTTEDQLEAAKAKYQMCQNLYENNTFAIHDIIGTHYHELDLYMGIKSQCADETGEYEYMRYNPITEELEIQRKKIR